jgi:hypothetical protein
MKIAPVALLLLSIQACAHRRVPVAVVRETRLRTDMALPLNDASHAQLIEFLEKGGDNRHADLVDPKARDRYLPLLRLLSNPDHLASAELIGTKNTFQKWFPRAFTDQVVDARNAVPASAGVAAVSDGRFWWIFTIRSGRLAELLVTQSIRHSQQR